MNATDPAEVFRQESRDLLEQLEQALLDLGHAPQDTDLVDSAFRALHTLKGSGAMFGFDAVAAFVHDFETAFDKVRKGQTQIGRGLIEVSLSAKDHVQRLIDEPGAAEDGQQILDALRAVVGVGEGVDARPGVTSAAAETAAAGWRIHFRLPDYALATGANPLLLLDELRELGDCEIAALIDEVPPLETLDPEVLRIGWAVRLAAAAPRSAIEDVFMFMSDDMALEITPIEAAPAEIVSRAAEVQPDKAAAERMPADAGVSSLRVPAERLDELMDRVGELVIAQARLSQLAANDDGLALKTVAEDIERLASELRETMMVVRMVPVSSLFARFRRLVHDLAQETGKSITLSTSGGATELDKTIIERLADPLVHLIRNAADHGLGTPEQRVARGKPAEGAITLAARQAGAEVVITVTDDGGGVNRQRVREKAEEAGLLAPGAVVSDSELIQLIFHPGFSTAREVTNLSGRGVGMDVVKRTIEGLRGSIEIASTPGEGSEVSLRIPLTLAIIEGLLVRVGASRYVIPLSAVEECVELSTEQDLRSTGRSVLTLRGQLVPFLRLREQFAAGTEPDPYQKVVVVSTGVDRVGLVVDQILGNHQTVIKPLSPFHAAVETFSGATILGDGGVALILDVAHLVAAGQRQEARMRAAG